MTLVGMISPDLFVKVETNVYHRVDEMKIGFLTSISRT